MLDEWNDLAHDFPSIFREHGEHSYGGNQNWLTPKWVRRCACGVVSGTDLVLYLHRLEPEWTHKNCNRNPVRLEDYNRLATRLRRRYIPILPRFGINGWILTLGLNRYFWENHMPFRAKWGSWRGSAIWEKLETCLKQDLPAILSIGPNFPCFWKNHRLTLYRRRPDGIYRPACLTKAHFVTVTGINPVWLRVSSWGSLYYIRKKEFEQYTRRYSTFLFSNLVYIRPK